MTALEDDNRENAERIETLMFTFDDLMRLDSGSANTLTRHIDKDKLAVALEGANDGSATSSFSNMSTRAAKMLNDDMTALGPVRLRDVDDAQTQLVNLAKDLAAKGEAMISSNTTEPSGAGSGSSGILLEGLGQRLDELGVAHSAVIEAPIGYI